jgi:hypothetical protein
MGRKPLQQARAQLVSIPENEERVVLATGGYVGEGFDDARLDTLFLTLPVSWRGDDCPIRRAPASPARQQARSPHL